MTAPSASAPDPCPWCNASGLDAPCAQLDNNKRFYEVKCLCGVTLNRCATTRDQAIKIWNTRDLPPTTVTAKPAILCPSTQYSDAVRRLVTAAKATIASMCMPVHKAYDIAGLWELREALAALPPAAPVVHDESRELPINELAAIARATSVPEPAPPAIAGKGDHDD